MELFIKPEVLLKYLVFLSKKKLASTVLAEDSYKIKSSHSSDNGKKVEFNIEIF